MEDARAKLKEEEEHIHPEPKAGRLSKGDIFSLSFGGLCLLLIALAPWITDREVSETAWAIIYELQP